MLKKIRHQGQLHHVCAAYVPKDSIKDVIDAGKPYLGKGVVAFDIAGGEKPGFCAESLSTLSTQSNKATVTVHAGEQWHGQNVYDAVTMLDATYWSRCSHPRQRRRIQHREREASRA